MIAAAFFILLLGAFAYFLPRWTRPDFFFAVTVPPGFQETADARRILLAYRAILLGFAVADIVTLSLDGHGVQAGFPAAVLIQMVGFFCAILVAHRRALRKDAQKALSHGARSGWLGSQHERRPGAV